MGNFNTSIGKNKLKNTEKSLKTPKRNTPVNETRLWKLILDFMKLYTEYLKNFPKEIKGSFSEHIYNDCIWALNFFKDSYKLLKPKYKLPKAVKLKKVFGSILMTIEVLHTLGFLSKKLLLSLNTILELLLRDSSAWLVSIQKKVKLISKVQDLIELCVDSSISDTKVDTVLGTDNKVLDVSNIIIDNDKIVKKEEIQNSYSEALF